MACRGLTGVDEDVLERVVEVWFIGQHLALQHLITLSPANQAHWPRLAVGGINTEHRAQG